MKNNIKLVEKVIKLSPGRTKKMHVLEESFTGKKAKIRKEILENYSTSDQIRSIRKVLLSMKEHLPQIDFEQLEIQDTFIDEIIKKG